MRSWPLLIWFALIALFCHLNSRGSHLANLFGMADAGVENIAAVETARIKAVLVRPGQAVKAGDAIAELDIAAPGANAPTAPDARKNILTLCASRGGIVSQVNHAGGDVVPAAEPIARIVGEKTKSLQGFLPETCLNEVAVGDRAYIKRQRSGGKTVMATVVAVGPEIQAPPGRFGRISAIPQHGRIITLKIDGKNGLIPGETVQISMDRPGWLDRWFLSR